MNSRLWSYRRLVGAFALVLSSLLVGQGVAVGQTRLSLTDLLVQIDAANAAIAQLQAQVTAQGAVIAQLQGRNQALEAKVFCISPNSTSTELRFVGCNVHIVNGQGTTPTQNGLGNLIIGYNEDAATLSNPPSIRTGSHNVVTGIGHSYTNSGGLVAGRVNTISGQYAAVTGGGNNTASGTASAVAGGFRNTASATHASVTGGTLNTATAQYSSVSGGAGNSATALRSTVSGGGGRSVTVEGGWAGGELSTGP